MKMRLVLRPRLLIMCVVCLWILGFTSTSQAISIDQPITKNDADLPGDGGSPSSH